MAKSKIKDKFNGNGKKQIENLMNEEITINQLPFSNIRFLSILFNF